MIYRVILDPDVTPKFHGLPEPAMDALITLLGAIVEDPYDPVRSDQAKDDPRKRVGWLGSKGFVELTVDDDALTVTVAEVFWAG